MDKKIFTIKPVILPISAPRPGNQLIGFNKSFCKNRNSDVTTTFDINSELIKQYPEAEFDDNGCFIDSLNLRIDYRLKKENNFSAFNEKDKFHQHCLNQLIENNQENFIQQWCCNDVERRLLISKINLYLELFEVNSIEDLFTQIRRICYGMEYKYSDDEIIKELKSINETAGSFEKNSQNNKTVLTYQPSFYKRENELYKTNPEWRRKLIDNCKAFLYKKEYELNDKEMLRQIKIAGLHNGFSHHSSFWIKAFIEKYNITSIADPTSGWGQREIGSKNIKYISNDIDPDIINGQKKIAELLKSDVTFYCEDASEFSPPEDYQAVFTCPPYFTVETFFTDNTSTVKYPKLEDWLNVWWRNVIKNWFKPSTEYFAFIINNQYKTQMSNICIEEGMVLIEEIRVGKANNLNHFQRSSKNSFKGEYCLIFKRAT